MTHQTYAKKRPSLLERIRSWLNSGPRWIVQNPEFTRRDPPGLADLFALRRRDRSLK